MQTITVNSIPETLEDFISLRNDIGLTPEGGSVLFIVALAMYQKNPSIGEQCLVVATDRSMLSTGNVYKGFAIAPMDMSRIKEQIKRYPYIANSYFKGATAENGYNASFPTSLEVTENSYSGNRDGDEFKAFVKSYGADSPRPIVLIKNNKGYWKAKNWSSLIMGIIPPKTVIDDDL